MTQRGQSATSDANRLHRVKRTKKIRTFVTCNQGWLRHLSTLYLFLILTWRRLLIRSVAVKEMEEYEDCINKVNVMFHLVMCLTLYVGGAAAWAAGEI